MTRLKLLAASGIVALLTLQSPASTAGEAVSKITPSLTQVEVMHNGKMVVIERSHEKNATIPATYNKVSRTCPPFCIQPMHIAHGVETIGELELLGYLKRASNGDKNVLVVDSRTPEWTVRGVIPGSVNVPWNKINLDMLGAFDVTAEAATLDAILHDEFGAMKVNGKWDFSKAKILALYCNGAWCPQSAINIKTLLKLGYPADKLKWYRGGMQDWVSLGLTTVKPAH